MPVAEIVIASSPDEERSDDALFRPRIMHDQPRNRLIMPIESPTPKAISTAVNG